MRPWVGLSPTTPQQAAGTRIEALVPEPSEPKQSRTATAAPGPLEEPPEICSASSAGPGLAHLELDRCDVRQACRALDVSAGVDRFIEHERQQDLSSNG